MKNPRSFLRIFFILLCFGFLGFLTMLNHPSLDNARMVDLVHLFGSGMCFGGALVALGAYLNSRRSVQPED